MNGQQRRTEIHSRLLQSDEPLSAGALAKEFGVSRQVIVGDIALLRASGLAIDSHARGYKLGDPVIKTRIFKVFHQDDEVEKELSLIIDAGGVVEDVFIFHKAYGKVSAPMGLRTRRDIRLFLEDIASGKSSLLKNVTSGYHYHTVSAESEETLNFIHEDLSAAGFLAPLTEFEPEGL